MLKCSQPRMGFRHSSKTYRLLTLEKNLIKLLSVCVKWWQFPTLLVGGLNGTMYIKHRYLYMVTLFPSPVIESKRKQSRGCFFLDSQMSLQVYPYSNTFNMAVMQFWKERNYFGVLGDQSFIVKKKKNCFFMPRGFLGNRMIVSDLILCWNIAVSGMGCLWD